MPKNKIRIKYTKDNKNCIISDLTDYRGITLSSIVFPNKTVIIIKVVRLIGEKIVAIEEQIVFGQMYDFAMNLFSDARHPVSFWTSFKFFGETRLASALILSGFTSIPL